jgi:hypothetical protein
VVSSFIIAIIIAEMYPRTIILTGNIGLHRSTRRTIPVEKDQKHSMRNKNTKQMAVN